MFFDLPYEKSKEWTLMFYLAGDSNNIESCLLDNVWQMKMGYSGGCNVIILFDGKDPNAGNKVSLFDASYEVLYERAFGEYFVGSAMFRMEKTGAVRIYGDNDFSEMAGDEIKLNMGDPLILEKFLSYSKRNYPAKKYALFVGTHGTGSDNDNNWNSSLIDEKNNKTLFLPLYAFSSDDSGLGEPDDGEWDYITLSEIEEIGKNLPVPKLDLFVLDVCYMANYEFLCQVYANEYLKPDYFVSCPSEQGIFGMNYKDILRYLNPLWNKNVNARDFAQYIVDIYYEYTINNPEKWTSIANGGDYANKQTITAVEGAKLQDLKNALDSFATQIHQDNRIKDFHDLSWHNLNRNGVLYYFPDNEVAKNAFPYFDIYDMAYRVSKNQIFTEVKEKALDVCSACDAAVLRSYTGNLYYGKNDEAGDFSFERPVPHATGISIFFPRSQKYFSWQSTYDKIWTSRYSDDYFIDFENNPTGHARNWYELLKEID